MHIRVGNEEVPGSSVRVHSDSADQRKRRNVLICAREAGEEGVCRTELRRALSKVGVG